MGVPSIVDWFDTNWFPLFSQRDSPTWKTLPRRDRVLALVGGVMDAMIGSGFREFYYYLSGPIAIEMVEAFSTVGMTEDAAALQQFHHFFPGGAPTANDDEREAQVDALPDEAWEALRGLGNSFEEWIPGGERVMLTRLYEWYHTQPENSE